MPCAGEQEKEGVKYDRQLCEALKQQTELQCVLYNK